MKVYKRPLFDEITIGQFHFQFFSVKLWQFGIKKWGGAIAFPTMSVRVMSR